MRIGTFLMPSTFASSPWPPLVLEMWYQVSWHDFSPMYTITDKSVDLIWNCLMQFCTKQMYHHLPWLAPNSSKSAQQEKYHKPPESQSAKRNNRTIAKISGRRLFLFWFFVCLSVFSSKQFPKSRKLIVFSYPSTAKIAPFSFAFQLYLQTKLLICWFAWSTFWWGWHLLQLLLSWLEDNMQSLGGRCKNWGLRFRYT